MAGLKHKIFHRDKIISGNVIRLGLPVIASNLSRTFMSLADMAMVGRLGASALAANRNGRYAYVGGAELWHCLAHSDPNGHIAPIRTKRIRGMRHSITQRTYFSGNFGYPDIDSWVSLRR